MSAMGSDFGLGGEAGIIPEAVLPAGLSADDPAPSGDAVMRENQQLVKTICIRPSSGEASPEP
jgi:hypothetical protein